MSANRRFSPEFEAGVRAKLAYVAQTGRWNASPSQREREEWGANYVQGWFAADKMSDAQLDAIEARVQS